MSKKNYLTAFILLVQISTSMAGFIDGSYKYKGFTRRYSVYVPDIYITQNKKVPLLLGLHGYGDDIDNFKNICMSGIADTANYICVYAEALPWLGQNAWNSGAGAGIINVNPDVDDFGYLNGLVDTVISRYMIDTTRMYVFGFSFGGFMTDRLATQSSTRFAAVANVSGLHGNFLSGLVPAKGIPYLKFHGTSDATISYDGTQTVGLFPGFGLSADKTVKFWVTQNHCDTTPTIDTMPDLANDGLRFVRFSYKNGRDNSDVIFYKVINGEHRWYGMPSNDISYCQTIWSFFRKYSRTSTVTSVRNNTGKDEIKIYPNPASSTLQIDFLSLKEKNITITMYDLAGNCVYNNSGFSDNGVLINTDKFPKGMYVLQIDSNDNLLVSEKVILQ